MADEDVIEEMLLIGDYTGNIDEIMARQVFDDEGRIIELDLSDLDLDEISPTIDKLDRVEIINLSNNSLEYIPDEIGCLEYLYKLILSGNPIESVPDLQGTVEIVVDHDKYEIRSFSSPSEEEVKDRVKKMQQASTRGVYPNKVCSWCNTASGYRKEQQRSDSKWGFTTHVSTILVCNNCSYMHQFYSGRSLLDFD